MLRVWSDAQWQEVCDQLQTGHSGLEELHNFISLAWMGIEQRSLGLEPDFTFLHQLNYAIQLILIHCERFLATHEMIREIEELLTHQVRTLSGWIGDATQLASDEKETLRDSVLTISCAWELLHRRVPMPAFNQRRIDEFQTRLRKVSYILMLSMQDP